MKYIIGNWKANKSLSETEEWFETFAAVYNKNKTIRLDNLTIVICPPFIYLGKAATLCGSYNLPIKLGGQDVSPFENGPFTGEVTASQLAKLAAYVIIGHSERRTNFGEDDQMLMKKVTMAKAANLQPIFCVQDENTFIPKNVSLVAYEPVWAIGTGQADTPENANKVIERIKEKNKIETVIYGGSITPENVSSFLKTSSIDGVLPGGSSLDPGKFWQMILNAASI